jgi:hypothetical protein
VRSALVPSQIALSFTCVFAQPIVNVSVAKAMVSRSFDPAFCGKKFIVCVNFLNLLLFATASKERPCNAPGKD